MPLTESQPINVHDITLEKGYHISDQPWFVLEKDVPDGILTQIQNLRVSLPFEAEKKVLGLSDTTTEIDKNIIIIDAQNAIKSEQLKSYPNTKTLVTIKSNLRYFGIDFELTDSERGYLMHSKDLLHAATFATILGFDINYPEPSKDYVHAMLNSRKIQSHILSRYKILGHNIPLNPTHISKLKNQILDHRAHIPSLLSYLSDLAILAAGEVKFGENGIELINPTPKTNLLITPPLPQVRIF